MSASGSNGNKVNNSANGKNDEDYLDNKQDDLHFDKILHYLGGMRRWQLQQMFTVIFCSALVTGMPSFQMMFMETETGHNCRIPGLNETGYESNYVRFNGTNADYNQCHMIPDIYSGLPNNTEYAKPCLHGHDYDRSLFAQTAIMEYDLVCEDKFYKTLARSIFFVGMLIGAISGGQAADMFGRKKVLFIALALFFCVVLAHYFAAAYWQIILLRMLQGGLSNVIYICVFVLNCEMVSPKWRTFTGVIIEALFGAGMVATVGIAYFFRDWRHMFLASLPLIVLPFSFFIMSPESPRWLLAKGKFVDAKKVIEDMEIKNKRKLPDHMWKQLDSLSEEQAERETSITAGKRRKFFGCPGSDPNAKTYTIADLIRTPNLRFRTMIMCFNWIVNVMVYYSIALNVDKFGDKFFLNTFLSACMEFPATVIVMVLIHYFGRRWPLCALNLLSGLTCILSMFTGSWLKISLAMVGRVTGTASFALIYVFTGEIYPTVTRSLGLGTNSMCARVGGIVTPYIVSLGDVTGWKPFPFVVFGVLSIIAGLTALLLPETYGKPLPETLEEGEAFGTAKYDIIRAERIGNEAEEIPLKVDVNITV